jgi:hypothetical protein
MEEFSIITYMLQVAPALGISLVVMYYLWIQYMDVIKYQREQDKENLNTLKDLGVLLKTFENTSNKSNSDLKEEIKSQAKEVKEHIDLRIRDIKKNNG